MKKRGKKKRAVSKFRKRQIQEVSERLEKLKNTYDAREHPLFKPKPGISPYFVYVFTKFILGKSGHGPGAWAVTIFRNEDSRYSPGSWEPVLTPVQELSGHAFNTTVSLVNFTALLEALRAVPADGQPINFYSNSRHTTKLLKSWLWYWMHNGWVNAEGQPLKHLELIQQIPDLLQGRTINPQYLYEVHVDVDDHQKGDLARACRAICNELVDKMVSGALKPDS